MFTLVSIRHDYMSAAILQDDNVRTTPYPVPPEPGTVGASGAVSQLSLLVEGLIGCSERESSLMSTTVSV